MCTYYFSKVSLSGPMEYYSETRSYNIQDTYSKIQIIPFVKRIDWDIRWQSLEARKCYLHNERKLTIFKIYTQLNCDKECEINETIIMCGCVDKDAACKYFNLFNIILLYFK